MASPATLASVTWSVSESLARRWSRRSLTIPAVVLLAAMVTALLPAVLPLLLVVDVARRGRLGLCRGVLVLDMFLLCEALALPLAFALFVGRLFGMSRERFELLNSRLQAWWSAALFHGGKRLLGMTLSVEGDAVPAPRPGLSVDADARRGGRPLLVFVRHVSSGDTLLPVLLLSWAKGWRPRYVLKRELLLDPCIDVVGQRLPNRFVQRGEGNTDEQVELVLGLYEGLGPSDAVVIFPEGTRFTPGRRQRLIERLRERGPAELLSLAEELQLTLPPLRAGALALLEKNPGADLLVIGHTGLDAASSLAGLSRGATVGARLRVLVRHVPFERLPAVAEERAALLADLWREVDRFAQFASLPRAADRAWNDEGANSIRMC